MSKATMSRWMACGLLAWLTACAASLPPPLPVLRLTPASLGASLALQQHLTVSARGTTQSMEAVLEVDEAAVRFAVLSLGQTALRIEWDGTHLAQWRAPWWPAAIAGERILSDLQLVFWPVDAIRSSLPDGWSLRQQPSGRELRAPDGQLVIQVTFLSPTQAELSHLGDGYRIRVDSLTPKVAP